MPRTWRSLLLAGLTLSLLLATSRVAMAAEAHGGGGIGAGAIVGLVVSFLIAAVLLLGSLAYILPKPPGR